MMQQKNILWKATTIFSLLFIIASCTKVDVKFGDSTIEDPNISYIDTISYTLSTIVEDSFVTSQTGNCLIGKHTDGDFGTMEAETFMHIGAAGINQVASIAVYDSAKLWIQQNGNYYGDTSVPFNLKVSALADEINLDGATYFFNTHTLNINPVPIASYSQMMHPYKKENIGIPLPNNFGTDLFNKLKSNSDTISSNDYFFQYIKGLSIKGTAANNAVYAFNCADSNVYVRIYYHTSDPNPVSSTVDFKYVNDNLQFNHVTMNRTGTALQSVTSNNRQRVSSTITNNRSFLQAIGGLQIRIDLPFIRSLKTENVYQKILRAELYIKPYGYTPSSIYRLPSTIILNQITDDNYMDSAVLDNTNGEQQSIAPKIDDLYGENTYYSYDITRYINNVIGGTTENFKGLMLQTPALYNNNAVDRLILTNSNVFKSVEVRIYRLTL